MHRKNLGNENPNNQQQAIDSDNSDSVKQNNFIENSARFLRGAHFFYEADAENIASFFVKTASDKGISSPRHFILVCGEIFFADSQIEFVRLAGHCNWGSTVKGSVLTKPWATSPQPSIRFDENFKINWEEVEVDSEFIAAFKYKDEMMLAWNIIEENLSLLKGKSSPIAKQIFSAIQNAESSEHYSSSENDRKYLTEIDGYAENYIENFEDLIINSLSTDNSGLYNLSHSDDIGTVGYTFVQQKIREILKQIIPAPYESSPAGIKKVMEEFELDEAGAREYIDVQKIITVENFIREGLPVFRTRGEKILADLSSSLWDEATKLTAIDWRGEDNDAFANEVKRKGFNAASWKIQKRWNIKLGTPTGKRQVSEDNRRKALKKRYNLIADAIKSLYKDNLRKTADENESEKAITMEAVADAIGITPQTLQIHVKSVEEILSTSDFDEADVTGRNSAYNIFRVIKNKILVKK